MSYPSKPSAEPCVTTFDEFVLADYSLMDTLNADPDATGDGDDHRPARFFLSFCDTTPLADPEYVAHSRF